MDGPVEDHIELGWSLRQGEDTTFIGRKGKASGLEVDQAESRREQLPESRAHG